MIRLTVPAIAGCGLLAGCVSPYNSAFQSCDYEAGACYQVCEDSSSEAGAAQCRQVCEEAANICFDNAYDARSASTTYVYSTPWYGSYGYWRPSYGYIYSLNVYGGSRRYDGRRDYYRRDDRRPPRGGRPDGRRQYDGGQGGGRQGGSRPDDRGRDDGGPRGGSAAPPKNPPPTRVATPPRKQPETRSGDRPAGTTRDGRRVDKD